MSEARDAGAPEGVEELIVRSGQGGRDRKFHIPAGEGGTDTLCNISKRSNNLYRKPCDVYPPGWFEWCDRCLEVLDCDDREIATDGGLIDLTAGDPADGSSRTRVRCVDCGPKRPVRKPDDPKTVIRCGDCGRKHSTDSLEVISR